MLLCCLFPDRRNSEVDTWTGRRHFDHVDRFCIDRQQEQRRLQIRATGGSMGSLLAEYFIERALTLKAKKRISPENEPWRHLAV